MITVLKKSVTTSKGTQNTRDLDEARGMRIIVAYSWPRPGLTTVQGEHCKRETTVETEGNLFVGSAFSAVMFL